MQSYFILNIFYKKLSWLVLTKISEDGTVWAMWDFLGRMGIEHGYRPKENEYISCSFYQYSSAELTEEIPVLFVFYDTQKGRLAENDLAKMKKGDLLPSNLKPDDFREFEHYYIYTYRLVYERKS